MRLPRVEEWSATGNPKDGVGFITYRRIPLQWWLLERWLARGHPHWDWWQRGWLRILPHWGDPFCAAYVTVWSGFYWSREEDRATVQVGWDKLPEAVEAPVPAGREDDDGAHVAPEP